VRLCAAALGACELAHANLERDQHEGFGSKRATARRAMIILAERQTHVQFFCFQRMRREVGVREALRAPINFAATLVPIVDFSGASYASFDVH
jgi:hypothetical protein